MRYWFVWIFVTFVPTFQAEHQGHQRNATVEYQPSSFYAVWKQTTLVPGIFTMFPQELLLHRRIPEGGEADGVNGTGTRASSSTSKSR